MLKEQPESSPHQPCSSLLVVEPETYRVSDLPERPGPDATLSEIRHYKESQSRTIRFCRDCKVVLLRISYRSCSEKTIPLTLHYQALCQLQKEIDEALPEFHEMILGLQKKDANTTLASSLQDSRALQADAAQARKELLARFTRYDQLAKRIRSLPAAVDKRASTTQQRLQQAISNRATLFLQKNMFPLQNLPSLDAAQKGTNNSSKNTNTSKHSDAVAEQIRVLTEQETLLGEYLAAAVKARNLDDVNALKANRAEIRAEIARIHSEGSL